MRASRPKRRKSHRRREPAAAPPSAAAPPAELVPLAANYELDVAPELVERGPDERCDRQPICSLPHDDI